MDLVDLGQRICILGPSNSGKSTLAASIGRARSLPVIHLDQYRHLPGTDWVKRPDIDFERMHNEAMDTDQWVIEGNYSRWLPGRLRRATGLVLLDASTTASIVRYFRRTLSSPTEPEAWKAPVTASASKCSASFSDRRGRTDTGIGTPSTSSNGRRCSCRVGLLWRASTAVTA
ncbi:hypothetical protein P9139_06370 [Curtobacterium flaccumfaciens]|nr:hypothetical protein P9139_06370 [Curtobacterium flaccumfaciens]